MGFPKYHPSQERIARRSVNTLNKTTSHRSRPWRNPEHPSSRRTLILSRNGLRRTRNTGPNSGILPSASTNACRRNTVLPEAMILSRNLCTESGLIFKPKEHKNSSGNQAAHRLTSERRISMKIPNASAGNTLPYPSRSATTDIYLQLHRGCPFASCVRQRNRRWPQGHG